MRLIRSYLAHLAIASFVFGGQAHAEISEFAKNHIGPPHIPHIFAIEIRSQSFKKNCINEADMNFLVQKNLVPVCDPVSNKLLSLVRELKDRSELDKVFKDYLYIDLKRNYLHQCERDINSLRSICSEKLQDVQSLIREYTQFIGFCKKVIPEVNDIQQQIAVFKDESWSANIQVNLNFDNGKDCGGANYHYGPKIRKAVIEYNQCVSSRDKLRVDKFNRMTRVDVLSKYLWSLASNQIEKTVDIIKSDSMFSIIDFLENPPIGDLFPATSYFIKKFKEQRLANKVDENYEGYWLLDFDPIRFAAASHDSNFSVNSVIEYSPQIYLLQIKFINMTNKIIDTIVYYEKIRIEKTIDIEKEAI